MSAFATTLRTAALWRSSLYDQTSPEDRAIHAAVDAECQRKDVEWARALMERTAKHGGPYE